MAQIDLKNATVMFKDGAAHTLTLKITEGQINYTEDFPRRFLKNRGDLDQVVDEDQQPVQVRLSCLWAFLTWSGSGEVMPEDAVKQRGGASGWTSSDPSGYAYAVDIVVLYSPGCSGVPNEQITLPYFRVESIDHDFKGGNLLMTGRCNSTQAIVARGV